MEERFLPQRIAEVAEIRKVSVTSVVHCSCLTAV